MQPSLGQIVVDSLARGEEVDEGVEEGDEAEGVLVVGQPKLVKRNCQGYSQITCLCSSFMIQTYL